MCIIIGTCCSFRNLVFLVSVVMQLFTNAHSLDTVCQPPLGLIIWHLLWQTYLWHRKVDRWEIILVIFLFITHVRHPIARPWGQGRGCRLWVEIWLKIYHCNCCAVCTIISYLTAVYRESIAPGFNKLGKDNCKMRQKYISLGIRCILQRVSRLCLYKMRVLKYYVENKALFETWK